MRLVIHEACHPAMGAFPEILLAATRAIVNQPADRRPLRVRKCRFSAFAAWHDACNARDASGTEPGEGHV